MTGDRPCDPDRDSCSGIGDHDVRRSTRREESKSHDNDDREYSSDRRERPTRRDCLNHESRNPLTTVVMTRTVVATTTAEEATTVRWWGAGNATEANGRYRRALGGSKAKVDTAKSWTPRTDASPGE